MDEDQLARKIRARARRRRRESTPKAPKLMSSQAPLSNWARAEIARGWYHHCGGVFYEGFGWNTLPPCPECGKKSRKAKRGEVEDAWRAERRSGER